MLTKADRLLLAPSCTSCCLCVCPKAVVQQACCFLLVLYRIPHFIRDDNAIVISPEGRNLALFLRSPS